MRGRLSLLFCAALCLITINLLAEANWTCDTSGPIPFKEGEKWGYLSGEGIVIPPRFDLANRFTKDGAIVCVAKRCGVIDKTGAFRTPLVSPLQISILIKHSEGPEPIERDGKWGYVNRLGQIVIPYQFEAAEPFDQGIARVSLGKKIFFINRAGEKVTQDFDGVFNFSEDLAAVDVAGKIGYIRRDGSVALPPIYHSASGIDFSDGLVAVRIDKKVGFMDAGGSVVIEPAYDDVYPFSEGLAPVRSGEKWGYIDKNGRIVIPIQYEIGHMFSEGVASVVLGNKWGYIDHNGTFVVPPTFESAMPFCAGVAEVATYRIVGQDTSHGCRAGRLKGKRGFIDHTGHYVWRDAEEAEWNSPFCF